MAYGVSPTAPTLVVVIPAVPGIDASNITKEETLRLAKGAGKRVIADGNHR